MNDNKENRMYLFSIKIYRDVDTIYRLVYAKTEEEAKLKCIKSLPYQPHIRDIRPADLFLATIF